MDVSLAFCNRTRFRVPALSCGSAFRYAQSAVAVGYGASWTAHPWFENRRKELANRPLIREQAFGEALNADKLERLGRYEVHLDRKLERMLAMLLRLKDLRRPAEPA